MKDYEDYIKEEEKQARLQEELEDQRKEEAWEAEANWRDWQRKQEYIKFGLLYDEYENPYYEDPFDGWPELDDYEDDDCYYPDCEDDYYGSEYDPCDLLDAYDPYGDLLDSDIPCEQNSSLTAEDLYDMYAYSYEEDGYCQLDDDYLDPWEEELSSGMLDFEETSIEEERISRKSVARNRHLNELKARKRAQKSADILKKRYQDSTVKTDYEEYRLYSRQVAAVKKTARVKTL